MRRLLEAAARLALAITSVLVALDILRSPARSPDDAHPAQGWKSKRVKRAAFWGVALLALAAIGGGLVLVSGIIPIKASSGHWPITAWFLKFTMQRSVATHSLGIAVPALDDPKLVTKGAGQYDIACRPCHGSPNSTPPRIARGMTPQPPDLQLTAPQYDAEELFYVVKHGVKFTGMPAWPALQRDDEVWAMVAFLRVLTELDAAEYLRLASGGGADAKRAAPIAGLEPRLMSPTIAANCSRCHGVDGLGRGLGAFPRLAGQRLEYLTATLRAYESGGRYSGIMEPIAAGLTSDDVQEVARYYARLDPPTKSRSEESDGDIGRGREIATIGLPNQLVPACVKCHGPGARPNPQYPELAGQYADYLRLQLTLFKERSRGGTDFQDIMRRVASQLSASQMRDVAAYFASLPSESEEASR
jgi:cytochrome c553